MFKLTESARTHLSQLLKKTNASRETAIRFAVEAGDLTLWLDNPRVGDLHILHEGQTLLLLDEPILFLLANKTLDVEQTATGPTLALKKAA